MKKAIGLFLLLFFPFALCASPDYLSIVKSIPVQQLEHPYLVFDNQSKKEILRNAELDTEAAAMLELLKINGERYMLTTPDVEPEYVAEELRARFIGGTNPYTNYRQYFLNGAQTLAFLYQLYGDEAYAQKAFYMIDKICALDTWIQKAHDFVNIYGRVWPWGVGDDQVVFSYDHTTGHFGVEVALVYDWLYPALTKAQRDRIRGAILEKVITKVRGSYEFHWWATAYKCNWSGICHSGAGMSALALLRDHPQLVDVVVRSCEGVEAMISNIDEDGGWAEGRGYWAYGLERSCQFMDAIKRATKGKINLFDLQGVKNTPCDFALFGMGGPFCDGGRIGPVGGTPFHNKFVQESGNEAGMWYLQNIQRNTRGGGGAIWWNLIWQTPKNVMAVKPKEASKHFRGIDWAFLRKDFGPQYMQLAVKSGSNGDPHHGFLDNGSVALTWQDESVIGKFPAGGYDLFVFDERRWEYLYTNSYGQNVVMVNDEQQDVEKHKNKPWSDHFIGGKIEKFQVEPSYAYTIVNPTQAYPGKELKLWKRWAILDKENNVVILLDKVGCAKGSKIDILFHSGVTMRKTGDVMSLKGQSADMEMRTLFKGECILETGHQIHHQIVQNDAVRQIPYYHVLIEKAPAETNFIANVFYPTVLKDAAAGVSQFTMEQNGDIIVITCKIKNQLHRYAISEDSVAQS